jgi:hypothetical protein
MFRFWVSSLTKKTFFVVKVWPFNAVTYAMLAYKLEEIVKLVSVVDMDS